MLEKRLFQPISRTKSCSATVVLYPKGVQGMKQDAINPKYFTWKVGIISNSAIFFSVGLKIFFQASWQVKKSFRTKLYWDPAPQKNGFEELGRLEGEI